MIKKSQRILNILLFSAVISVLVIGVNMYEYFTVRRDITAIMRKEALNLMDAIFLSSRNIVTMESLVDEYLYTQFDLIRAEINSNTNSTAVSPEEINPNLTGYYIVNKSFSIIDKRISHRFRQYPFPEPDSLNFIKDFTEWDIIALDDSMRAALSPSAREGNRYILFFNASEFNRKYRDTEIGKYIRDLGEGEGVHYIVLQDSIGIIYATPNVETISRIQDDEFLQGIIKSGIDNTRFFTFDGKKVFEVVKPFFADENVVSVFRIGITNEELSTIQSRALNRILLIIVFLIVSMIILFRFLILRKTYSALDSEFTRYKTYSEDILENMTEAVVALNKDRKISYLNRSFEKLFNIKIKDVNNKELKKCPPAVREILEEVFSGTDSPKIVEKASVIGRNPVSLIIHASAITSVEDKIETYIAVIEDVSERKKIETELRNRERMSLIGRMASAFAHEIRNPLNALSMVFQRFSREFSPAKSSMEYTRLSSIFKSELDRINIIVEDFLTLSRPAKLNLSSVSPADLLDDLSIIFNDIAGKKRITFTTALNVKKKILLDEEKFKQVVFNLFLNAVDAVENDGKISISLNETDGFVRLQVKDNGTGIEKEKLDQIFDWYFTDKSKGSGMGLTITKKIVEAHGGQVFVESKPGEYTVFTVTFPVKEKKHE